MKPYFRSLLLAVVFLAGGLYAADNVVFVDLGEVFKQFYKTQLAQSQIKQQADDIKIERQAMESEMKEMREAVELLRLDSRDETLSEEVRDNKRNELEEKLVALQKSEMEVIDFEKLRMKQLEQQNMRMTRKLFDEIQAGINAYAKEQGFSGVIDRSSQGRTGMPLVLFANVKNDITAEVLAELNQGRESKDDTGAGTLKLGM